MRHYPRKSLYKALNKRASKRHLTGAKKNSYVYGTVGKIKRRSMAKHA